MKHVFTSWGLFFLVLTSVARAQTSVADGWKAFLNNDREKAKTQFEEGLKHSEQRANALLGLALMSDNNSNMGEPFSYFKQFYDIEKEPSPYLYALWFTGVFNPDKPEVQQELVQFLKQFNDKSTDGTLKAMVSSRLGKYYADARKSQDAAKAYSRIGALEGWAVTGEFENISTSGFDKNYETLKKPASDATFINKLGATVKWFVPPYARKDKWFDFTYYFNFRNSVVFAQSFVKSPVQQEVQLRAGVSGSMKAWVNDNLVISEPEERNNDLDSYIRTIKLNEGYNRILVQVGESYAGRSNFLIRLTDAQGNPVEGLSVTPAAQSYQAAAEYNPAKIELPYERYFQDKIKTSPDDPLNYILLTNIYLQGDKPSDARRLLDKLKASYPSSTYLNTLLLDVFRRSDNRTGLESVREAIKMNDPAHPYSLNFFYTNAIEKQDYKQAGEYVDKMEAIYGKDDPDVLLKRIELAGKNKNQAELVRLAEDGYSKYPANRSFVEYKYLIESGLRKNNKAAIAILRDYLKDHDDYEFARALAGIYFDSGNAAEGIKIYEAEISNDPAGTGIYTSLAKIYSQLQNYPKAEECQRKALELAPYEASFHADLAGILKAGGKKDEAVKEYKQALNFNPNSYIAIRELRKLENKKDVFDYFKPFNAEEVAHNAPAASAYPDDNALILDENADVVIYEGGGSEERHRMLAKILNSSGLEGWKEYSAPVKNWQNYIIENAEVIKANGSKVPAEVNETQIVFTNLEVGDCIFVQYKLFNYSQGQLANKFWDSFYFSHGYPYLKSAYNVLAAKNQTLHYKFSQQDIPVVKSDVDEFELYSWSREKQPSLKYEDKMPALDDVGNVFNITTIPDWTFVSHWYNDMASAKARPAYEVKEAVNSIFTGKEKLTDTQKAEKIYNYITNNITYSSVSFRQSGLIPQNPAAVLNTRIGDCKDVSTLFLSMAKEAGINANLVLVNTKDAGVKGMLVPTIDFNHCIIKINTDGKERYLELTSNYLPFSSMTTGELNSAILDIDGSSGNSSLKFLNPSTRKMNNIVRSTNIVVEGEDLVVTDQHYQVAASAAAMRQAYEDLSPKDRDKTMQETLGKSFPSAQLTKLTFRNLENSGSRDTVYTTVEYRLKDEVKKIGGLNIMALPWTDKAVPADFTISYPRNFPLELSQLFNFDSENETITLRIPAGKKIIENVGAQKLSDDFIEYNFIVKQTGQTVTYSRSLRVKQPTVPADKVAAFHELYKKVISTDNKQIAFK